MIEQLGWHWVFDAQANPELLADETRLRSVLRSLPAELGLRTVSEPQSFAHQDNDERSVAGIILIAESHLSLHAFADRGLLHGDLFSCKPFDVDKARALLSAHYGITAWNETVLDRGERQKQRLRAS